MSLEVIPLRFAQADDVADKLTTIFQSQKETSTVRRRTDDVPGGDMVSKIIPDLRTNSLIVMATREGLGRVLDVVSELDKKVEAAIDKGRIHVKYLKHAHADDMASLLSGLITGVATKKKPGVAKATSAEKRGFTQAAPLPWEHPEESTSGENAGSSSASTNPSVVTAGGTGQIFESDVRIVADSSTDSPS